ncbi:hypothetical protein Bca4012_047089 [Brassica carinata]
MTEKLKRKLGHNNLFWRSNKLGDIDIAWRESEMCVCVLCEIFSPNKGAAQLYLLFWNAKIVKESVI